MDVSTLKTDTELIENGVWVPIDEETRVKVCSVLSKRFNESMDRYLEPFKKTVAIRGREALKPEQRDAALKNALVEMVQDWEGMKEDGKEIPFSREKCREYMEIPAFRNAISQEVERLANFQLQTREAAAKN